MSTNSRGAPTWYPASYRSKVLARTGTINYSLRLPTAFLPVPPRHPIPHYWKPRKTCVRKRRASPTSCSAPSEKPAQRPSMGNERLSAPPARKLSRRTGNGVPRAPLQSGTVFFMAICNEFSMASLYRRLLRSRNEFGGVSASATGSVLRLTKPSELADAEAFVFPYGCMVVWGTQHDADDFLSLVVEDAFELRAAPAVDHMDFKYGDAAALQKDVITLTSGQDDSTERLEPALERLAISCALAQSIKLGAFESSMRMTIENTRHLPEELARSGEITASRKEVARLMGQLFLDRYRYHLSGDLLMTPTFFWENEQYLPSYRRVERYLEVRERGEILDKRVEVVQELYTLLGEEVNHRHSAALELAITIMIAFEILLTLLTLAKESMRRMFSACALFFVLSGMGWSIWILYRRLRFSRPFRRPSRGQ